MSTRTITELASRLLAALPLAACSPPADDPTAAAPQTAVDSGNGKEQGDRRQAFDIYLVDDQGDTSVYKHYPAIGL